jgi:hypothetical protein
MKGNIMQVNSVQSSPNFGMALRIKCPKEDLVKLPKATVDKLGELGKEFKANKYADMHIIENARPVLSLRNCANAYANPSATQQYSTDFINLSGKWKGGAALRSEEHVTDVFRMSSPESAKKLAELSAPDEYEHVAEFVREFEKRGDMLAKEAEFARDMEEARDLAATDLLKNYGCE